MREYHPLDVRHPANRDLLRRNFLLDPPRATSGDTAPSRAAPSNARPAVPGGASGNREAPPSRAQIPSRPQAAAAPWGRGRDVSSAAPVTQRRKGSGLSSFLLVGLFLVIFGAQNGWVDPVLDWLRQTAWQFGITLPF